MAKIVVTNHVTLDGVMQAPGGPDGDSGFPYPGWAEPRNDEAMGRVLGERMGAGGALLIGRRTYEHLAEFWPYASEENPYTKVINSIPKYVASRTLSGPLEWNNAHLLEGDTVEAVSRLKRESPTDLAVLGSADFMQTLMRHHLIDAYLLMVHPLVLGAGRPLFPPGSPKTELVLKDTVVTTTGVIMATYVNGLLPTGS
jgi:dihydrofolate reductase